MHFLPVKKGDKVSFFWSGKQYTKIVLFVDGDESIVVRFKNMLYPLSLHEIVRINGRYFDGLYF